MDNKDLMSRVQKLEEELSRLSELFKSDMYIKLENPDYCPNCHKLRTVDREDSQPGYVIYKCTNEQCANYLKPDLISIGTLDLLMDLKFASRA